MKKSESLPLIILGAVVLIVGGALYWFLGADERPADVSTNQDEVGVVAEERGARRGAERVEEPSTPTEEVVSRRFAESLVKNALSRDPVAVDPQSVSSERLVLSCRLEGVAPEDRAAYRLQPAPLKGNFGVYWAPVAAGMMPADGSPLELDVTEMREIIERSRGFMLAVTHSSGAEHSLTFDLDALPRRVEGVRSIVDVVVALGEVSIVKGRVVTSDTEAVGFHLSVYAFEEGRPLRDALRTASTGAEGRFELLLDRTKEWLLVCSSTGHAPLSRRIMPHAEPVYDLGTLTLLEGESITGLVTRLGVPQPGLRVRAVLEDMQRAIEERVHIGGGSATWRDGRILWIDVPATTGADGIYRMTGLDRRRYHITVESADGGNDEVHEALRANLRRDIVAPAGGVDFEVGGVMLKIRVRDEAGPLQDWLMSLTTSDGESWTASPIDETAVRTVYVPAETLIDVVVSHEKCEPFHGKISFPRSESSANYEVVMKPLRTARLRVRVRDHEALGIRSLSAYVKGTAIDQDLPASHQVMRSFQRLLMPRQKRADLDADGFFTFEDLVLAKGRHEITFRPDGPVAFDDLIPVSLGVDLDPERENAVEIGFERGGYARFGARDANGAYVEAKATLRDPSGNEFAADMEFAPNTAAAVGFSRLIAHGTDRLSNAGLSRSRNAMAVGPYRIEVEREDGTKRSADFVIKVGETVEVVVVF